MTILISILLIIASILLALIILAQNPKGGGLSGMGAGASQHMGARAAADFMEKATWYFGLGIMVLVIAGYAFMGSVSGPAVQKPKVSEAADFLPQNLNPVQPAAPAPQGAPSDNTAPQGAPAPQDGDAPAVSPSTAPAE